MNKITNWSCTHINPLSYFKYEPPSFVYVEIRTSSRALAMPYVVQHAAITKPISPLRGGMGLAIIPSPF
jgi:hypothetical protein